MIHYPISFFAEAKANSGIQTSWTIASKNIENACAVPSEFEGPGGALSPEDLFVQALTNCFVATFKVYAEKSRVEFSKVSVSAELIADLDAHKKPVMKSCTLRVKIEGSAQLDRVRTIAEKAFQSGFILNSVKTEVKLELNISP